MSHHTMSASYDPVLVAVSVLVAVLASYVALDLTARVSAARRLSTSGWHPMLWGFLGAVAMGSGIWSMHFIGMLALQLAVPIRYDLGWLVLSMIPAIAASGLALFVASRAHVSQLSIAAGALTMGVGIATMHYTGMTAIVSPGTVHYHSWLWWLSIAIAVLASWGALTLAFTLRGHQRLWLGRRAFSALVMGIAIAGMHYTGMAAADFPVADLAVVPGGAGVLATRGLAIAVTGTACAILGLALLSAAGSVRLLREEEKRKADLLEFLRRAEDARRTRAENQLRLAATALAVTGSEFFPTALRELLRTFNAASGMIARLDGDRAETVVFVRDGEAATNFSFPITGTVCAHVLTQPGVHCVPDGLPAHGHDWLGSLGAVGYIGAPLQAADHSTIGFIAIFTQAPLHERGEAEAMLQIFGTRVAGEMQQGRTEEALRASQQRLFQIEKMEAIGQLAGGVAHDFNNMLTVIIGYGCELSDEVTGEKPAARVREILKAAERSKRLTQQLLAFSSRQILQPKPLSLDAVVASLHGMLHRIIGEDIRLIVKAASSGAIIHADPGQIEQVVLNLVINARDAMRTGGALTISTERVIVDESKSLRRRRDVRVPAGQYVVLEVSDTGHGMSEATVARVFEPFFSTKGDKGTGLGLATVHGIVKQSDAFIFCRSRIDEGTTFTIYFPQVEHAGPLETIDARTAADVGGDESVLVVEDEDAVRHLVVGALVRRGYRVIEASSAGEALMLLCDSEPDMMLADVVIPGGMSGRELAAAASALHPGIRTLLMSGYTEQPLVIDDAQPFIQKPFTPDELCRAVRDVLRRDVKISA